MNKWIGSGRLTENPVIRYNADKVSFVTFTVMCKRNKRIREGDQPVDFIDCICFGNIARLARDYLYKDKKVEIIGPLQSGPRIIRRMKYLNWLTLSRKFPRPMGTI